MLFQFSGVVASRSSLSQIGGPPGEAEILAINPQRKELIMETTGWASLQPGTLNLEVTEDTVHKLLLYNPLLKEEGNNIVYPAKYAFIPRLRVGYLYYKAIILKDFMSEEVLVRRACNPLVGRLEIFSEHKIREKLNVSDGDILICQLK